MADEAVFKIRFSIEGSEEKLTLGQAIKRIEDRFKSSNLGINIPVLGGGSVGRGGSYGTSSTPVGGAGPSAFNPNLTAQIQEKYQGASGTERAMYGTLSRESQELAKNFVAINREMVQQLQIMRDVTKSEKERLDAMEKYDRGLEMQGNISNRQGAIAGMAGVRGGGTLSTPVGGAGGAGAALADAQGGGTLGTLLRSVAAGGTIRAIGDIVSGLGAQRAEAAFGGIKSRNVEAMSQYSYDHLIRTAGTADAQRAGYTGYMATLFGSIATGAGIGMATLGPLGALGGGAIAGISSMMLGIPQAMGASSYESSLGFFGEAVGAARPSYEAAGNLITERRGARLGSRGTTMSAGIGINGYIDMLRRGGAQLGDVSYLSRLSNQFGRMGLTPGNYSEMPGIFENPALSMEGIPMGFGGGGNLPDIMPKILRPQRTLQNMARLRGITGMEGEQAGRIAQLIGGGGQEMTAQSAERLRTTISDMISSGFLGYGEGADTAEVLASMGQQAGGIYGALGIGQAGATFKSFAGQLGTEQARRVTPQAMEAGLNAMTSFSGLTGIGNMVDAMQAAQRAGIDTTTFEGQLAARRIAGLSPMELEEIRSGNLKIPGVSKDLAGQMLNVKKTGGTEQAFMEQFGLGDVRQKMLGFTGTDEEAMKTLGVTEDQIATFRSLQNIYHGGVFRPEDETTMSRVFSSVYGKTGGGLSERLTDEFGEAEGKRRTAEESIFKYLFSDESLKVAQKRAEIEEQIATKGLELYQTLTKLSDVITKDLVDDIAEAIAKIKSKLDIGKE